MNSSIPDNTKRRGRPKTTGQGQLIGVRMLPHQLAPLDAWIADQPEPKPSRPEAIRALIGNALSQEWELRAIKIKQAQYDDFYDWLEERDLDHVKYFNKDRDENGEAVYAVEVWAEPDDLLVIEARWG